MSQSFFYHNKSLMRTSNLQIPTVENIDGKLSVKFSTKTYPEFLKDNTQTNLRSVDLGGGNHSYTVQRNIVFAIPKAEEIEQPKVEDKIVESNDNKLIKITAKNTLYYSETDDVLKVLSNSKYKFISPIIKFLDIKFAYNSGLDDFGMAGATSGSGNIELHPNSIKNEDLIAHEFVHAAIKKMEGLNGVINIDEFGNAKTDYKEFRNEFDKLSTSIFNSLVEYRKLQKDDGFWAKKLDRWIKHIEYSGNEEIITFALTDNHFQKVLKELPSTYSKKTNNLSAWNDFIDLIEKFLEIFNLSNTQLNSIVALLNDYIPIGEYSSFVESQQKLEVREKPQLQQRRGNGKSIERKKPLSEEDLLPSFSKVIDEQVGFEIKEKSPNLQMDFITYAKLQPNEIKRSLIAMNRNKEIEVKCK